MRTSTARAARLCSSWSLFQAFLYESLKSRHGSRVMLTRTTPRTKISRFPRGVQYILQNPVDLSVKTLTTLEILTGPALAVFNPYQTRTASSHHQPSRLVARSATSICIPKKRKRNGTLWSNPQYPLSQNFARNFPAHRGGAQKFQAEPSCREVQVPLRDWDLGEMCQCQIGGAISK